MRPRSSDHLTIRGFWATLPTEGRWLLSTVAVQTLGRGLTLPFTIIYLHEVRGISLDLAGALMALIAVVALVVTGPGGSLTDTLGARRIVLIGSVFQAAGCVVLAFATTPLVVALSFVLLGVNFGISWPAFNAFIAAVVRGPARQQYYGINFALVNLGIGAGGVIGGLFVDVGRPDTFTLVYLIDAASMAVPIGLLLGPLRHVHARAEPREGEHLHPGSYAAILRRPAVAWLTLMAFVGSFIGYGQMEAGFPAFARQVGGVSTTAIGMAFAVNTATIVLLQFLVLRAVDGRRRTRVLVGMAGLWASSWVVLGLIGVLPASLATAGVLLFAAVFGVGETLLQPTLPAITNDLAADHLRGRYNAVSAAAFQAGTIAGPVVAGLMLARHLESMFIGVILLGALALAAIALRLERHLTPEVNGLPASGPLPLA